MKQVTYFVFDYEDFEALIRKEFKRDDYEFVADEEANNYSAYTFENADGKGWEAEIWQADIKRFEAGGRSPGWKQLVDELIKHGVLEPGNYMIQVYW